MPCIHAGVSTEDTGFAIQLKFNSSTHVESELNVSRTLGERRSKITETCQ